MADIEHKDIADPNIHEPKGVATATEDAVYVADGSGGGAWQRISYGIMSILGNTTAFTPSSADITDYKLLNNTGWQAINSRDMTVLADDVNDSITVTNTGVYDAHFWASFDTSASSGTQFAFRFAVNGVLIPVIVPTQKNSAGSDTINVASKGISALTAGDILSVYAASSASTAFTVVDASFALVEII